MTNPKPNLTMFSFMITKAFGYVLEKILKR